MIGQSGCGHACAQPWSLPVLQKWVRRLICDRGVKPPAAVRRLLVGWCLTSAFGWRVLRWASSCRPCFLHADGPGCPRRFSRGGSRSGISERPRLGVGGSRAQEGGHPLHRPPRITRLVGRFRLRGPSKGPRPCLDLLVIMHHCEYGPRRRGCQAFAIFCPTGC